MSTNYGCSECNKTFGRKDNAERHNENMHDGLATIYDKRLKSDADTSAESKTEFNPKNPLYQNKFKKMQLISDKKKKAKMDEFEKLFLNL